MTDFPVTSLFSVANFHPDDRKFLGCARFGLCFIDTAILVHFMNAAGAFMEAKNIREQTPEHTIRFGVTCALGAVYLATFLSFFITYCCNKDAITLIRARLVFLLTTGFISFVIVLGILFSAVRSLGTDHDTTNEFAVDLNRTSDFPWLSVLGPAGTSAFVSFLAGTVAVCFFHNFRKLSSLFNPFSSYIDVSPESPYSTYWKPSRRVGSHGDYPRSPLRDLYPHRALLTTSQSAKKTSPRHQAIIQELKTTLPSRNEQRVTVL